MNAMIASLLTTIDTSNYKLNIGDAPHRIKLSPDGASLVQATLAVIGGYLAYKLIRAVVVSVVATPFAGAASLAVP